MTDLRPAAAPTDEAIATQLFPELRQSYFGSWLASAVGDRYPVAIDLTPLEQVERLTSAPAEGPR